MLNTDQRRRDEKSISTQNIVQLSTIDQSSTVQPALDWRDEVAKYELEDLSFRNAVFVKHLSYAFLKRLDTNSLISATPNPHIDYKIYARSVQYMKSGIALSHHTRAQSSLKLRR